MFSVRLIKKVPTRGVSVRPYILGGCPIMRCDEKEMLTQDKAWNSNHIRPPRGFAIKCNANTMFPSPVASPRVRRPNFCLPTARVTSVVWSRTSAIRSYHMLVRIKNKLRMLIPAVLAVVIMNLEAQMCACFQSKTQTDSVQSPKDDRAYRVE